MEEEEEEEGTCREEGAKGMCRERGFIIIHLFKCLQAVSEWEAVGKSTR